MNVLLERLRAGILKDNPIFAQAIGMCPTLAVTSSAGNGFGMGAAVLAVLLCSNAAISLLRRAIPNTVRIPAYIVIIAGFVTVAQFCIEAWAPELNRALGIFIPLIVVNCVILGRAEAYASKKGLCASLCDALGMGLGFGLALTLLGAVREILGAGTLFGRVVVPSGFQPALMLAMAPGAFIALGVLLALVRSLRMRKTPKAKGAAEQPAAGRAGQENSADATGKGTDRSSAARATAADGCGACALACPLAGLVPNASAGKEGKA